MEGWHEVESLTVTCVVDNVTDILSEPPACCGPVSAGGDPFVRFSNERTTAAAGIAAGTLPCLDFSSRLCHAAHGLSMLLTAQPVGGGPPRTVLFDAGPEGQVWRTNAQRLGLPVGDIEAVVLSHWHMDHSGGLPEVARMIGEARSASGGASAGAPPNPPAVFDVHPQRPARRGLTLPSGQPVPFNPDPSLPELEVAGATVVQAHAEPHTLCGGAFYVSGPIPRLTAYEKGNPGGAAQWEEGGAWESDPEVPDERFLAVRVAGLPGPVVLSACSHAGIVNVMRAAAAAAGGASPYAVIGGLHLGTVDCTARIEPTVADIQAMQPGLVVAGHCTGWRAQAALVAALPGRVTPGGVGCTFTFAAAAAS